jgi:hypothetical protein
MNALLELQRDCRRAFAANETSALLEHFVSNAIPSATRVKVYENNLRETYRKTLRSGYPVVERLVGERCFSALAGVYAANYPSTSGDLQNFGTQFAQFLEQQYGASAFSYLSDVARLERAIDDVLSEAQSEPLEIQALGSIEPGDLSRLRFGFAGALRLIGSDYPVLSIWQANQPGREADVDLNNAAQWLAVRRRGDEAELHRLDRDAFDLATKLREGKDLGAACEELASEAGSDFDLANALGGLLRAGCLASLSVTANR